MKLTESKLRRIVQEELQKLVEARGQHVIGDVTDMHPTTFLTQTAKALSNMSGREAWESPASEGEGNDKITFEGQTDNVEIYLRGASGVRGGRQIEGQIYNNGRVLSGFTVERLDPQSVAQAAYRELQKVNQV